MAEYSGSALYLAWIHSGGTVTMHGDFRTFSFNPSVKTALATAGSDADEAYLAGVKDASMSVGLVAQSAGTALEDALVEGASGTLLVGPEGTASNKRKWTIPAISMGASFSIPYDNVVEMACDFQKTGALTRGLW